MVGWIVTIGAALAAQHPSPSNAVPTSVIVVSLLAILGGAVLPSKELKADEDPGLVEPRQVRIALVAGCLMLVASIGAAALWSLEPFGRFLVFTRTSSSWAA
ncbi:MAG: hypothetical protein ACRDGS_03850, partial [Chloroflexota bacterium]